MGFGLCASLLEELSERCDNVICMGHFPIAEAGEVLGAHEWCVLAVNGAVLDFAFLSKTPADGAAGCKILAICEKDCARPGTLGRFGRVGNSVVAYC